MSNKYNITNMPSLIRRKDFFKVAQNPSNYPSLGTLDDRAKAPQQATPTSGGGRGGYPSFDALDPRRPQASPPAQQQQQASAQTQLDLNVSPNDPKAVQKMQAVIIDFGNVVSTNAVKAGKFLVDYVKSDQTQKGSSREKLDNVVKGMSAIGAAGKESTPDNIWMGKTDTALENISKFGLALKNFFSAEQNISVPQTILSSIDELSNLIKTKYTQLSQAEKNSRAARIITIITNIKALFNYLENVPQDPVSPQDSLQQVSGPSQDSSSILVFYDKIPQVIDLNQIAPSASDSIVITSNVLQTPELLTKYLQQYGVKVKGKDGQDLDINKDNIYAVAYFLKMRASTSQSRFKDKYAKQAEDLFQTTAPNKLKTYTNEQILTKLAQLGAPLNTNNVNLNAIKQFMDLYSKMKDDERTKVNQAEIEKFNRNIGFFDSKFSSRVNNLNQDYDTLDRFVEQHTKTPGDPKNMHGYLSTLINIVQNVQQIVDDLMEYSEDLNRLGQSQFVDQLKDQRAGGAVYDDNMAKLNEFYQLFSRKNLKGMP